MEHCIQNYGRSSVLYTDTDSLFYVRKKSQTPLPTGDFVGELRNELGENEKILRWFSTASKSYGYLIVNTVTGKQRWLMKMKGDIFFFHKNTEKHVSYIHTYIRKKTKKTTNKYYILGFSLTQNARSVLIPEVIAKRLMTKIENREIDPENQKEFTVYYPDQFRRCVKKAEIRSVNVVKKFNINFDKAVVKNNGTTVPFGY